MVKLLSKEFDIFALRKTQSQRVDHKAANANPVNDIQTKIA